MNNTLLRNAALWGGRAVLLVLLLVGGTASPAPGAIFEWVDERGVVSFTDSRENIPEKYRGSAREKVLPPERTVLGGKEAAPASAAPRGGASPQSPQLYGGRTLAWWRGKLTDLRVQIRAVETELADQRDESVKLHRKRVLFQKGSDRAQENELKRAVEENERRLKELQEQLQTLESEAAAAGVPRQ